MTFWKRKGSLPAAGLEDRSREGVGVKKPDSRLTRGVREICFFEALNQQKSIIFTSVEIDLEREPRGNSARSAFPVLWIRVA